MSSVSTKYILLNWFTTAKTWNETLSIDVLKLTTSHMLKQILAFTYPHDENFNLKIRNINIGQNKIFQFAIFNEFNWFKLSWLKWSVFFNLFLRWHFVWHHRISNKNVSGLSADGKLFIGDALIRFHPAKEDVVTTIAVGSIGVVILKISIKKQQQHHSLHHQQQHHVHRHQRHQQQHHVRRHQRRQQQHHVHSKYFSTSLHSKSGSIKKI